MRPVAVAGQSSRDDEGRCDVDDAPALRELLRSIDGRGYGAWKRLAGVWTLGGGLRPVELEVERVQPDPFAPPTRLRVCCPAGRLGLPDELLATPTRRRALGDHLLREAGARLSPPLAIDVGGQQVVERTAARLEPDGGLTLRLAVALPDRRRRVRTPAVAEALLEQLPASLDALCWDALDRDAAHGFVGTVEDATTLRARLADLDLVAFVADGAVLARRSGIDDRPAESGASVPFVSPPGLRVEVELPHRGRVTGMGVGMGVTLVVGGGFHGKSTLLAALRDGVHDHVPGDGRELVITRADAVTVRAEDGRRVERVDISAFVDAVPDPAALAAGVGGQGQPADGGHRRPERQPSTTDTSAFSSDDASGSTSQAAAIVEAVEAGAGLLLIDEDTAATNLMTRDRRMEALILPGGGAETDGRAETDGPAEGEKGTDGQGYATEPITPFVDLVRSLADDRGVATVLVAGSGGDYLAVADRVIQMEAFAAHDVTARATEVVDEVPGRSPAHAPFPAVRGRVIDPRSVDPRARGRVRTRVLARDRVLFGTQELELSALEQLVDRSQTAGVAAAMVRLVDDGHLDGRATLREALDALERTMDARGLDALRGSWPGDLARPRPLEVAAALNRLRSLRVV